MNKNDFTLKEIVTEGGHIDYWFKVDGESKIKLEKKYMEMCMIGIYEVVYSKDEDMAEIKRLFPFNFDVIMPDDKDLKSILSELAN